MKSTKIDWVYKKALKVKHVKTVCGAKIAVAILEAPDWWAYDHKRSTGEELVRSTRLMVHVTDLVVCGWMAYSDGAIEAKETYAIFRDKKDAELFYKMKCQQVADMIKRKVRSRSKKKSF